MTEPGETVREKLEKAQAKILTMMRAADAILATDTESG